VCVCLCVCVCVVYQLHASLGAEQRYAPNTARRSHFFLFSSLFFLNLFFSLSFLNLFTSRLFFFQFIFLKSYEVSQSVCSRSVLSLLPRNGIKYNKKYMIFFFEYNIM
jgi:hypothetical protein